MKAVGLMVARKRRTVESELAKYECSLSELKISRMQIQMKYIITKYIEFYL